MGAEEEEEGITGEEAKAGEKKEALGNLEPPEGDPPRPNGIKRSAAAYLHTLSRAFNLSRVSLCQSVCPSVIFFPGV